MRRPDLFGALIANVAILNPTRLGAAQNGAISSPKWAIRIRRRASGTCCCPDSFQLLASADVCPTRCSRSGSATTGSSVMPAKFAARALAQFGDRRLILLRTEPDAGHGVGSADQVVEQYTDVWAFVLNQAGAEGFTASGPAQPSRRHSHRASLATDGRPPGSLAHRRGAPSPPCTFSTRRRSSSLGRRRPRRGEPSALKFNRV